MDSRTLDASGRDSSDIQDRRSDGRSSHPLSNETCHSNVKQAIASAMQELRQLRLDEQLARPVRYEPQNKLHRPDPDIAKTFKESVNQKLETRRLSASDWLRFATWWLLKARNSLANCSRHHHVNARGSFGQPSDSKMTSLQAYTDLLKASYILYDIVLEDESSPALSTDENRKSIADLAEGINEEFSQYLPVDIPEPLVLQSRNLELWEPLQPEEAAGMETVLLSDLQNARWIAVNQGDAGDETERVLYRAFVNAGIGSKKFRLRTKGAPYILLLATRDGDSEPKIILCNQSGSLCLQRDFTPDDLEPLIYSSNANSTGFSTSQTIEPVSFDFGSTKVSISFQFDADLQNFVNIPKTYFDAVRQRQPIDAKDLTENLIFRSSVEIFEQVKTPNMQSLNPPRVVKSCDVRILERSYGETWQTIRRIVISSSVAEKTPRCIEFFMPLSRVQLHREDTSRHVLVQWSDTSQEETGKTDGSYNALYSYVYDEKAPNIGTSLHFRTQQGAEDFERALLEMTFQPNFAWSEPRSSGHIYDVVNTGVDHKQYRAVVLFQAHSLWRFSEVYYVYRDTDYAYEHSGFKVRFPRMYYADYISTHVDQLYQADAPVSFSHSEKKSREVSIEFSDESTAHAFLSALSPLWELRYSRRIQSLSSKSKLPFGSKKSGEGGAELQAWRRGKSFQLAARWDDGIPNKWFTMAVASDCTGLSKEGLRLSLPRLSYSRGVNLDMMNIMAHSPKATNQSVRTGPISILFHNHQGSVYLYLNMGLFMADR
ncbi:hypothetical protein N7492_005649 [Penicillium capsulatum]|uniref:Uncharacterized protein n=1 Tax=Penicillium capsulatum TaxID=69766 RepID=A0A9W9ICU9_9EURO|nr:hypothetical protein N7492_005649 [Penicillium capsulatum]